MSHRIAVLGGGIAGLAAARELARGSSSVEVCLFEGGRDVGGWMKSVRTEEGAVFELGPRSLRTVGPAGRTTLGLVWELGLGGELLPVLPTQGGARRRLILTQQHGLVEIPSGPSWLLRTKPPFSHPLLIDVLGEVWRKGKSSEEDESVHSFFSRRLGTEVANYLIDPLCRGVFAGSATSLSVRSCFPQFYRYEKEHGSLIRGAIFTKKDPILPDAPPLVRRAVKEKWQIYSLCQGLQTLPDALHSALVEAGGRVFTGEPCTQLHFKTGAPVVEVNKQRYEVDHVVSAIPSHALAAVLPPELSSLADLLSSIPSVSVGVVCLEFPGNPLPQQYREAFGYLVPSHQPSQILGVVFDSSTFPQHDRKDMNSTRLTVMLGGEWFEDLFGDPHTVDTDTIVQAALDALRGHLEITEQPTRVIAQVHKNCIPQYRLGHSKKLESISNFISERQLPLTLIGSSYRGVSVNDCIHHALEAARTLTNTL